MCEGADHIEFNSTFIVNYQDKTYFIISEGKMYRQAVQYNALLCSLLKQTSLADWSYSLRGTVEENKTTWIGNSM